MNNGNLKMQPEDFEAMGGVYVGQWYKGKEIMAASPGGVPASFRQLAEETGRARQHLKKWHELYKKYPNLEEFIKV